MDNSKLKLDGVTFKYGLADGIRRGGDKTFAIYRHADGSTENVSYNEIKAEAEALMEKLIVRLAEHGLPRMGQED